MRQRFLNFKDNIVSTKDLPDLMLYKLPRKFVSVQLENKKTPEFAEIRAFTVNCYSTIEEIKRCVCLKFLIIDLLIQHQHADQ